MMVSRPTVSALLLLGLAGCGALSPFETVAPPAPAGTSETQTRVAVCYSRLGASAAQVRAIAIEACDPGTSPRPEAQEVDLNRCPLLTPVRATFICTAP